MILRNAAWAGLPLIFFGASPVVSADPGALDLDTFAADQPEGYIFDNTRYGGYSMTVVPCDDLGTLNNPDDPARYHDDRVIITPPGADNLALTVKIGEI